MNHARFISPVLTSLGAAAVAMLVQGCTPQGGSGGEYYRADQEGAARTCVAAPATPADGQTTQIAMQVSNEGGWCGASVSRRGVPFDTYMLVRRPVHGRVFAHRVGNVTRIDYRPDRGFVGSDNFAVRLIPGNAIVQGVVTVTP